MKRPGDFTENLANSMRIPGVTLGISCELVFLRTWEVTSCCYMLILLHSRMNKPKMERCMHGTLLLASSVIIYHQYRSLTVLITAKITIAQSVEYSTGSFHEVRLVQLTRSFGALLLLSKLFHSWSFAPTIFKTQWLRTNIFFFCCFYRHLQISFSISQLILCASYHHELKVII